MLLKIIIGFLLLVVAELSPLLPETQDINIIANINPELEPKYKGAAATISKSPKQDGDGDGDGGGDGDGAAGAAGGLAGISGNLNQIGTGISSGSLGGIFSGAASFIGDSGTRETVTGLLSNLDKVLTMLIGGSINQFFGALNSTQTQQATTLRPAKALSF